MGIPTPVVLSLEAVKSFSERPCSDLPVKMEPGPGSDWGEVPIPEQEVKLRRIRSTGTRRII
jgi:hypothetical protein